MYSEADIPGFFNWYYKSLSKHYYEHIHDDRPVRLYFDLEFNKSLNPFFDWRDFWPKFQDSVETVLKTVCGDQAFVKPRYLSLDSSTDEKFSKHIIMHTTHLFPNNWVLKPMITLLCDSMRKNDLGIVRTHQREDDLILDAGVYDRRRNFRMFLSTKFGKKATLEYDFGCDFYSNVSTYK